MNDNFRRLSDVSQIELICEYLGENFESFLKQKLESGFVRNDIITDGTIVYLVSFPTDKGVYCQYLFGPYKCCSEKEYDSAELWFKNRFEYNPNDDDPYYDGDEPYFLSQDRLLKFYKVESVHFSKGHTSFNSGKLKKSLDYFVSIDDLPNTVSVVESKVGQLKVRQ